MRGQRSPHPARVIAVDHVHPSAPSAHADHRARTPGPNSGEPRVPAASTPASLPVLFDAAGPHPPIAAANDAKQDS
jgi:hypothetical protein